MERQPSQNHQAEVSFQLLGASRKTKQILENGCPATILQAATRRGARTTGRQGQAWGDAGDRPGRMEGTVPGGQRGQAWLAERPCGFQPTGSGTLDTTALTLQE